MKVKELWRHVDELGSLIEDLSAHADDVLYDGGDEIEMTEKELKEAKRIAHLIFDEIRPIINE
jgi:hypothetical protein